MRKPERSAPSHLACLIAAIGTLLLACDWEARTRTEIRNLPPSVQITGGAAEGAAADYRVEFFWFGSDPDGFVDHFVYAIDDTCLCRYTDASGRPVESIDGELCDSLASLPDMSLRFERFYDDAESIWKRIDAFSGSFNFQADDTIPGLEPARGHDLHTFYVKAVDDHGVRSSADYRRFDALTIAPFARILRPTGRGAEEIATVSTDFAVRWLGRDEDSSRPDKKPVGYQLKLVVVGNAITWPKWLFLNYVRRQLKSPHVRNHLIPDSAIVSDPDSVYEDTYLKGDWYPKKSVLYQDETIRFRDLAVENYAFAVRAVDEAGAIMPFSDFFVAGETAEGSSTGGNILKIDVNPALAVHPHMWVREHSMLGEYAFAANGQEWEVEVPVNVRLHFEWQADASWYGSRIGGTNYALDIPDPGCEVCQAPDGVGGWAGWGQRHGIVFSKTFSEEESGEQHVLYIRARDESFRDDHELMVAIVMNVVALPFDRTALWVDDFIVSAFNDCLHDAVISPIVNHAIEPYLPFGQERIDELQANPRVGDCGERSNPTDVRLSKLGRYKLLYWNVSASPTSALGKITDPTSTSPAGKYLSIYVQSGGNLIVWGRYTFGALLGDFMPANRYIPCIPQFADCNFGPGSFPFDVLQLRTMFDRAGRADGPGARQMRLECSGLIGIEATARARELGFPAGTADPTGYSQKTALWYDRWSGRRNPSGWPGGNAMVGVPSLRVAGMDTLYIYLSNSWAWEMDRLVTVCGSNSLSPIHGDPVVVRYDDPDPLRTQGKVVWIGVPLYIFAENHLEDLKRMMRGLTDWIFDQ